MKKKRIVLKRAFAVALTMGLTLGSLAGCGKNSSEGSMVDQATKVSKEHVFRSEKIDLGDNTDYSNVQMVGDRIYASTYAKKGYVTISSFNYDGSDVKSMKIPESDNEGHGYMSFDKDGNLYTILQIYSDVPGDGDVHIMEEDESAGTEAADTGAADAEVQDTDAEGNADAGTEGVSEDGEAVVDTDPEQAKHAADYDTEMIDDDQQYLVKYDNTGKELYRIDLEEDIPQDEYLSIYKMIYNDKYGLILSTSFGIKSFDESTKTFKTLLDTKNPDSEYADMSITLYNSMSGQIYASTWTNDGIIFSTFDPATGKLGEASEQFKEFEDYSFFTGNGYDMYVSKTDGFYGYDHEKGEVVKILDYAESDINLSFSISSVVAISDTEFVANLPDEDFNYSLYRLTKVAPEDVKDRTILTVAGSYVDYSVRQKINKFNQENPDYKFNIVDYSSLNADGDWTAGSTQFNLDIVSGNAPDIMFFTGDEPVGTYINKGLFLDLMPYIQNDPELKDTEFVSSAFDAFKTGDKLYQLVPSFYINTVSCKTSLLRGQETITLQDCQDIIDAKGLKYVYAFGLASQESILNYGMMASGDKFIDWKNKKCNFDSPEFIEFLEFIKKFPTEIPDDMWQDFDDTAYMNDEALFSLTYLNGFRAYRRAMDGTFGTDISLIGFPNDMGINCSAFNSSETLAISSKSKHPDVCWQLIREFYSEDYQNNVMYEFPIRKSSFDKQAEESMDRPYWVDSDGVKQYEDDYVYAGDQQIKISPLNKEDVQVVKDFVNSVTLVNSPNSNVNNIIIEEATPFFNGQKTAKEVADIIQSRLSIYVNENS